MQTSQMHITFLGSPDMVFIIPPQNGPAADMEHFEITDPRSLGLLNRA